MEEMFTRVETATSLEPYIAKAAIGHVLLFLRDEIPNGHVGEFIDKNPSAREFVDAAYAKSDAGVTQAIEGLTIDEKGVIYLVAEDSGTANSRLFVLTSPVPEPGTVALMLLGLGVLARRARTKAL